jgi:transcriptional regulator with XRE-family HTH domain
VISLEGTEFGKHLKGLRKAAKLSMANLAEASGVSQPYISQIERGERGVPSPEILKKLSTVLNTPYLDLMLQAGFLPSDMALNIERRDTLKGLINEYQQATSNVINSDKNVEDIRFELQQAEEDLKFLEDLEKAKELTEFLKMPGITYKGKALSHHDRNRIAGIIEYLFADERGKENG